MMKLRNKVLSTALLIIMNGIMLIEQGVDSHEGCRFVPPTLEENDQIQNDIHVVSNKRTSPILCTGCVTVNTYVVVFRSSTGEGSQVNQNAVNNQINILNQRFADTPFRFNLVETQFVVNNNWYLSMEDQFAAIGIAYRRGTLRDLNIYIGGINSGSTAFFPPVRPVDGSFFIGDGTFVAIDTLPGGTSSCCNLGLTLVHEVGHFFGLHHTFEGNSCADGNPGDYVDDTPQQSVATDFDCPASANSCPNQPFNDPINNYMDYSSDECYTNFSPGQVRRMFYVWSLYRDDDETCPSDHVLFELQLNTDSTSSSETNWQLTSTDGEIAWGSSKDDSGLDSPCYDDNKSFVQDMCIPRLKSYNFTIIDVNGLTGRGSYSISVSGTILKRGQAFTGSETTLFDTFGPTTPLTPVPTAPPTIARPILNPTFAPIPPPTSILLSPPTPNPVPSSFFTSITPASVPTPIPTLRINFGPQPSPSILTFGTLLPLGGNNGAQVGIPLPPSTGITFPSSPRPTPTNIFNQQSPFLTGGGQLILQYQNALGLGSQSNPLQGDLRNDDVSNNENTNSNNNIFTFNKEDNDVAPDNNQNENNLGVSVNPLGGKSNPLAQPPPPHETSATLESTEIKREGEMKDEDKGKRLRNR